MAKRTPEQLEAHHKALAEQHGRKAKIAKNGRLIALDAIRRKLEGMGEIPLASCVDETIDAALNGEPIPRFDAYAPISEDPE